MSALGRGGRWASYWLFVGLLIATASTPVSAQSDAPLATRLDRDEALQLAASRNLGILVDAMERDIAKLDARAARQPFVPVVFVDPEYRSSPATYVRPPEFTYQADIGAGVRWNTTWGTSMGLSAQSTPWYDGLAPLPLSTLQATLSQSLLRGGWDGENLLELQDLDVELQRALFVERLNALLVEVEGAYWELAYTQAEVESRARSRDRARQQFEDTRENIRRGLLAPGDLFVVEENLVIFEEQLLRARERLKLARLELARLLQLDESADGLVVSGLLDEPLDVADVADVAEPSQALALARRENPRIEAQRVLLEKAGVQLDHDVNQARPVLDLNASVGLTSLDEEQGEAWAETLTAEYPSLRLGLYFELPLLGAPFEARVERARLAREQQIARLQDVESEVENSVRRLLVRLEASASAQALAQRRVELAEKKLEAEQEKYERGLATLNDVVRFQRDLDVALSAARRARVELVLLRAELARTQGVLHSQAEITIR